MQDRIEGFQLSPQQRRVWLLGQCGAAYRSQLAVLVEGDLRAEALAEAVGEVVARHEILRTTFRIPAGLKTPLQVVADECRPGWRRVDLSDCPTAERDAMVADLLREERERDIDAEGGPLLQLCLIRLSAARHYLSLTLPSVCADARSLDALLGELAQALRSGDGFDDEPLQYADFSQWQNELLEGEEAREGRGFWSRQKYAEAPAVEFPFEGQRGGAFAPASLELVFDHGLVIKLRSLLPAREATAGDFLRACWLAFVARVTGRTEFFIGELSRGDEELEGAIGLYAKWLPLACRVAADASFDELLAQSAEAARAAREWQEYFAGPAQAGAAGPFAAGFEYGRWPAAYAASGLSLTPLRPSSVSERFKVKLSCLEKGQALSLELHYDSSLLGRAAAAALAEQFVVLLAAAVENPQSPVGELELLGAPERQRLLVERNDTGRDFGRGACVQELFEAAAARRPDAPAVVFEDEQLSYAELNARANRLARRLRALGAGPESVVGIYLERSSAWVVAMLAALKAGAAYLPLDPAQPRERLGYVLGDARPLVVLTDTPMAPALDGLPAKALCVDALDLGAAETDDLPRLASPDSLAYVIYTSGSTGQPKGVLVEHRQLFNYVKAVEERLRLPGVESYATVSTFAADLGHTSVFPALCFGGCLHVVEHGRACDASAMAEYFGARGIDLLKIVPSHLEALLASPEPAKVLPRRRLVLGGEAARRELVERVRALAPDCEIYNHYGPTETTVGALAVRLEEPRPEEVSHAVALGGPLANVEAYVLDAALRPVASGVLGELYIGGAGVTRGYLSKPGATAEKFIPDPFSGRPGARLYRTGDLVRLRPDAQIEFAGRADNQVKFHGFRVELDEIRHALTAHAQIRDGVVRMLKDGKGGDVLVAYYVSRRELDAAELRDLLSSAIQTETIPNLFVHLKRLPLTLNGKVNHRALPSLEECRERAQRTHVAPRTPAEQLVAEVWGEALGVERVSIHDNFFEIGGHSLLATRVTTRLRQEFGVDLPLRALFEEPTVAGLALLLTRMQVEKEGEEELLELLNGLQETSGDDLALAARAE